MQAVAPSLLLPPVARNKRKESLLRQSSLGNVALASLALALVGFGCESSNKSSSDAQLSGGKVIDRDQSQTSSPDGSATRTRTQTRETPSGATVKETQTEERKVIQPGQSGQPVDATKSDPGQQ
jgi:hypothetical protein